MVQKIEIDRIETFEEEIWSKGDWTYVDRLAKAIKRGATVPPITVEQKSSRFVILDGTHRINAMKRLGRKTIKAIVVK